MKSDLSSKSTYVWKRDKHIKTGVVSYLRKVPLVLQYLVTKHKAMQAKNGNYFKTTSRRQQRKSNKINNFTCKGTIILTLDQLASH